ncbi:MULTISPECIES: hypothetical protein [Methylocystis]|uniref:hypothetical protein n=1 Tax=Methylocystis TaxID=133 RepID=UPI001E29768A|nr:MULTISPECIES: hypothetical protein [Methylocystis]
MKKPFVVIVSLALAAVAPPAFAEDQGVTSGPAAGKPVEPSGAVQKENPKNPVHPGNVAGPSGTSAGAPSVEGKRGTQSGKEWTPPAEIRRHCYDWAPRKISAWGVMSGVQVPGAAGLFDSASP